MNAPRRDRERGIALVVVLWMMALLTVLVLGFTSDARTELRIARNQEGSARARAIADAGVTFAVLGMLDPSATTRWHADGQTHAQRYGGGALRISVQDEGGKIDLNNAPAELLSGLFRTLGSGEDDAPQRADAILAWRTTQSAATEDNGQSDNPPPSAPPPQQSFLTIDELRLVPGITPELFERVKPFITVYSSRPQINPLTAPAEVLRSLPGANPADVAAYVAARDEPNATGAPPSLQGLADIAEAPVQIFTVTAQGVAAPGARFTREVIVAVTGTAAAPVQYLSWR